MCLPDKTAELNATQLLGNCCVQLVTLRACLYIEKRYRSLRYFCTFNQIAQIRRHFCLQLTLQLSKSYITGEIT